MLTTALMNVYGLNYDTYHYHKYIRHAKFLPRATVVLVLCIGNQNGK